MDEFSDHLRVEKLSRGHERDKMIHLAQLKCPTGLWVVYESKNVKAVLFIEVSSCVIDVPTNGQYKVKWARILECNKRWVRKLSESPRLRSGMNRSYVAWHHLIALSVGLFGE